MIVIRFRPQAATTDIKPWSYRVAARCLITDVPLGELAALGTGCPQPGAYLVLGTPPEEPAEDALVCRVSGWIGGQQQDVECWAGPTGYRLAVAGVGLFAIAPDGRAITLVRVEPDAEPSLVTGTVLGPTLCLALALQGTFCLHASAVAVGERVVAYAGDAGAGKSTLAAFLGAQDDPTWRRVADDALPVTLGLEGPMALPHFPQPGLPPEAQVASDQPERMPLVAVYLLSAPDEASAGQEEVEIDSLSPREAMSALIFNTIAACLFDRDLLAQHMTFCAETAARVPVRRLVYPHNYALLPRVRDAIAADLESLHLNRT